VWACRCGREGKGGAGCVGDARIFMAQLRTKQMDTKVMRQAGEEKDEERENTTHHSTKHTFAACALVGLCVSVLLLPLLLLLQITMGRHGFSFDATRSGERSGERRREKEKSHGGEVKKGG